MRPLLPLLLTLTCGVSLVSAQRPGGMGGGGRRGGPPGLMGGRRMQEPPSEDLVRGPYGPDSMIPKFRLDSAQAARYRGVWDSTMAATRPARDSIRDGMDLMRRARSEGYSREGERQAALVQRLGKRLKKEEQRFDKVIRRFLSKEQWEEFKDWRGRRRETERELRRQRMEEGPGEMMGGRRRG